MTREKKRRGSVEEKGDNMMMMVILKLKGINAVNEING